METSKGQGCDERFRGFGYGANELDIRATDLSKFLLLDVSRFSICVTSTVIYLRGIPDTNRIDVT